MLAIVSALAILTVLVGTERLSLTRATTAAPTAGCQALPKAPPPPTGDPIGARGAAGVAGFGRFVGTPQRQQLSDGNYARISVRFDNFLAGQNRFECASSVDVFQRLGQDGVLASDYTRPESQRMMIFLSTELDGAKPIPVFAVPPIPVAESATGVFLRQDGPDPVRPGSTSEPSMLVSLAVPSFTTSLPTPEAAVTVKIINTTSQTLSEETFTRIGIARWTVMLTSSAGAWTATRDVTPQMIGKLAPGSEWSTTEVVTLRGPAERRLQPGPAVLSGQLVTKGRSIEGSSTQIRLDPA